MPQTFLTHRGFILCVFALETTPCLLEEVYLKKPAEKPLSAIIVGVAVSPEEFRKLKLPEEFVALVEKKD